MTSASDCYVYYQIWKVGCYRQSRLVHIYTTSVALSYKHILYTEVAYTNCLASSLNIYAGRTLVLDFGALFTYLFINKKPYYSSGLSLNRSIDLTSISL